MVVRYFCYRRCGGKRYWLFLQKTTERSTPSYWISKEVNKIRRQKKGDPKSLTKKRSKNQNNYPHENGRLPGPRRDKYWEDRVRFGAPKTNEDVTTRGGTVLKPHSGHSRKFRPFTDNCYKTRTIICIPVGSRKAGKQWVYGCYVAVRDDT